MHFRAMCLCMPYNRNSSEFHWVARGTRCRVLLTYVTNNVTETYWRWCMWLQKGHQNNYRDYKGGYLNHYLHFLSNPSFITVNKIKTLMTLSFIIRWSTLPLWPSFLWIFPLVCLLMEITGKNWHNVFHTTRCPHLVSEFSIIVSVCSFCNHIKTQAMHPPSNSCTR